MTLRFLRALLLTLDLEGGGKFTDLATDRGGKTRWGVTEGLLREYEKQLGLVPTEVSAVKLDTAMDIYHAMFWAPLHGDDFASDATATKLFEVAVNTGQRPAVEMLQRCLNADFHAGLVADGKLGPATIAAANKVDASALIAGITAEQIDRYRRLADADAQRGEPNRRGWLSRAIKGAVGALRG